MLSIFILVILYLSCSLQQVLFTFTGTTNILAHTLYGIKHAVTAALHIVMGKYFYIHYQIINNTAACRSMS